MWIQRFVVDHLRNLSHVDVSADAGVNWFIGANASGKTSLLEALHVLAMARSFRARADQRVLIQDGSPHLTVYGEIVVGEGIVERLGVEKRTGESTTVRINGSSSEGVSGLISRLPILLIDPNTHLLISGSPGERRAFLDWGVFHVEHGFLERWRRYKRILSHRNALLRQKAPLNQISGWDQELVPLAEWITQRRRSYLDQFIPLFREYAAEHFQLQDIEITMRSGWSRERSLAEVLAEQFDGDRAAGHTRAGPHRADLRITVNGQLAAERVSRGQQKLLAAALRLAQAAYFYQRRGEGCVLLVDDLPAELDHDHRQALFNALIGSGHQVFITATDMPELLPAYPPGDDVHDSINGKVFYVENGAVRPAAMV